MLGASSLLAPFAELLRHRLAGRAMLVLFVLAVAVLCVVVALDGLLQKHGGHKYSDLETAGTTSAAARALASWDARQQVLAAFSAGLHFLFLFLYGPFLLLANVWVADHSASPPWLVRASSVLALLQPVGMACDVINQSVNIATLADGPKSGALGFHLACSILHLLILTPAALLALVFVVWIRVSGRQNQTAVSAEGGADNMALSKS